MKNLLPILIFCFSLIASAQSAKDQDLQKIGTFQNWQRDFLALTGLQLGTYRQLSGPKECERGEVELLDAQDSATLEIDSRAVFIQIPTSDGGPVIKPDDDGCTRTITYKAERVTFTVTQRLRVTMVRFDMTLTFLSRVIFYLLIGISTERLPRRVKSVALS